MINAPPEQPRMSSKPCKGQTQPWSGHPPFPISFSPPVDCDVGRPRVWQEILLPVADKPGTAQLHPNPLPHHHYSFRRIKSPRWRTCPPSPLSHSHHPLHPPSSPALPIAQPAVPQASVQVLAIPVAGQPQLRGRRPSLRGVGGGKRGECSSAPPQAPATRP